MPYTMLNHRTEIYTIEHDNGFTLHINNPNYYYSAFDVNRFLNSYDLVYINQQAAFFTLYYNVSSIVCSKLFVRMWLWDAPDVGYILGHKAKFVDIHKYFIKNKRAFFEHGADNLFYFE